MNVRCFAGVLVSCLAVGAYAVTPSVTDVTFKQDAHHVVRVTYKLTGADAIVTADVQTNSVSDGSGAWASVGGAAQRSLGGDINRKLAASDDVKSFAWVPDATWEGVSLPSAQMRVVVTAWTELDPPDYLVADLRCPSNCFYYATEEFLPGGVHDIRYKTEYIVFRRIHAKDVVWTIGADKDTTTKNVGIETLTTYPSNARLHKVKLTYDYWMGIFELTKAQCDWAKGDLSNDRVGTTVGNEWVSRNSLRAGTTAWPALDDKGDFGYRRAHTLDACTVKSFRVKTGLDWADLPTEAEWEFACRAGVPNPLYSGKKYSQDNVMELAVSTFDGGRYQVSGTKRPNAWGLYDMLGNRAEYCLDWYETWDETTVPDQTAIRVDPYGASSGTTCVVRGGHVDQGTSWYIYDSPSSGLTCHYRTSTDPSRTDMGANGGARLMARIGDPE